MRDRSGGQTCMWRPDDFVELPSYIPDLLCDLCYYTGRNFVGRRIEGYEADKVLITRDAAIALAHVQDTVRTQGLGIMVFDAYRPQRAVDHFMRWAADSRDHATKAEFYPSLNKSQLVPLGYLMPDSAHSRGSTVDLTLVDKGTGKLLDMGTSFDFFDPRAWPDSKQITREQQKNRALLQDVMQAHGFMPIATEWWHFTLCNEPYPDTYFDFPVA